jgi:hypothetical protein
LLERPFMNCRVVGKLDVWTPQLTKWTIFSDLRLFLFSSILSLSPIHITNKN